MIFEERAARILSILNSKGSATVADLANMVGTSESTVRRDIAALDQRGKLRKVYGGAAGISNPVMTDEYDVREKANINVDLKKRIARYAANAVHSNDMVYIDAGTTTLMMIPYIHAPGAVFVTNGLAHARMLAHAGYVVYLTGGRFRARIESAVGHEAAASIEKYNFTKCFMGTNGIDAERGFTTPDIDEALIKETAMNHAYMAYVLADSSKFGKVSTVTFSPIGRACIITDAPPDECFGRLTVIKVVGEED